MTTFNLFLLFAPQLVLQNVGVVAVAASVIPLILIPVVPLLLFFLYLRRFYLCTSRDVKRLESTSMHANDSHRTLSDGSEVEPLRKGWLCPSCSTQSRLLPPVLVPARSVDHQSPPS